MRKILMVAIFFLLSLSFNFMYIQGTSAVSPNIIISQVQSGALSTEVSITTEVTATKEFISIYNNSVDRVDITDWCLTNKVGVPFACFTPTSAYETLHLSSFGYATISSDSFSTQHGYLGDVVYPTTNHSSGSITAGSDTITLIDANGSAIDAVSWTTSLTGGSLLQRRLAEDSSNQLLDTDATSDFQKLSVLVVPPSSVEEVITLVDLCSNITDTQVTIPDGYIIDTNGECVIPLDVCGNIAGLQVFVPDGYGINSAGNCVVDVCQNIDGLQDSIPVGLVVSSGDQCHLPDVCINLDGLQESLPDGYYTDNDSSCWLDLLEVRINEIMPNPAGDDTGHEFIEIYNPYNETVSLNNYKLLVGSKYISFPQDTVIAPKAYYVVSNSVTPFTLTNTGSDVSLWSIDGRQIGEKVSYISAPDDESWALIDNSWQYTNQLTPGSENLANYIEPEPVETSVIVSELKPCAPNQYRSPETNRCRLLVTVGSVLVACKDGQYRSEITNRCRNIASDVGVLGACDDKQERNPETNRCRNIVSSAIPQAAYAVEPFSDSSNDSIQMLSFLGISLVAIFYAIWEWRPELKKLFSR